MIINNKLLDEIERQARESQRLRANLCFHKSPEENVQKMINYLMPNTRTPVHKHKNTNELLTILRGEIVVVYFSNDGEEINRYHLAVNDVLTIDIPKNQWHNVIVNKPCAVLEIKEGPYRPLLNEEIM